MIRASITTLIITLALALSTQTARAECNCSLAVAGDVSAAIQAEVAKADGLYARGDYDAALALYAKAYGTSKDASLVYAQAMVNVQLGAQAKARALFEQYIAASGSLHFKDRAQAQLGLLGGATAAVSTGAGKLGGLGGDVGRVGGGAVGGVAGGVGGTVDTTANVAGSVKGDLKGKAKVGRKAGIILGVIAIAAIGAVAIHSIAAGVSADVELDPKFDLGLGVAGVAVGISAIYVAGLTAATGAAAGAPCVTGQASNAKAVGLSAGIRF